MSSPTSITFKNLVDSLLTNWNKDYSSRKMHRKKINNRSDCQLNSSVFAKGLNAYILIFVPASLYWKFPRQCISLPELILSVDLIYHELILLNVGFANLLFKFMSCKFHKTFMWISLPLVSRFLQMKWMWLGMITKP